MGEEKVLGRHKRRVACYATLPFQLRSLKPIADGFEDSLISYSLKEIMDWQPDVIITADVSQLPLFREYCDAHNVLLIGMRHGPATKYTSPEKEYSVADYVCASDWDVDDFTKAGVRPKRGFLLTGNPWVDDVFKIPERKLCKDAPTILFAPTYNPEVSAARFFEDKLANLIHSVYPRSKIIIKPHPAILQYDHPYVVQHREIFRRWIRQWLAICQDSNLVTLIDDPAASISQFFPDADILISDGSSLIFEFMVLNRPILLYTSPEKVGIWEYDSRALGNAWRDVGTEFTTQEEFIFALKNAFVNHSEIHSAKQKKYTNILYGNYQDGRSTERVIQSIKNLPYLDIALLTDKNASRVKEFCEGLSNILRNSTIHVLEDIEPEGKDSQLNAFFEKSDSQFVMVIDYDRGKRLQCADFISRSLQIMSQDPSVAAAGRLVDGWVERSFAIFDRKKVLDVGGFSKSDSDLCMRLLEKGWKVISAWDDRPVIRFESGFYDEEHGVRWMAEEAVMRVGWSVCDVEKFPPLCLTFDVVCSNSKHYPNFPFSLKIYDGEATIKEIRFDKSYKKEKVEILLPCIGGPHTLRFISDESYVPREIGINGDPRRLSVMINNVKLKAQILNKHIQTECPVRLIAFYLPQFHPIPENDKWWGKGFTDWDNVRKAKPLFEGHYQPHMPADLGYYDLRNPEVREAQAEMAKKYGIEGFCYWHYWFNGKMLLERPFNEVLESGKPDFPFCLAWANENWTRNWDGHENLILQPQEYGGEADDFAHFEWLLKAFRDPRYIKVDGKPLFLIYRPMDIPNVENTLALWRQLAGSAGLQGLYVIAIRISLDKTVDGYWLKQGFDAELLFQPSFGRLWDKYGAGELPGVLNEYGEGDGEPGLILNYNDAWHVMASMEGNCLRTVVPSWDNTPRRKYGAFILRDSTPKAYGEWLKLEIERVSSRPPEQRIVFINAWNEWGEGNHLEPDVRFGHGYLEATKRAIVGAQTARLYSMGKLHEAVSLLEEHIMADQNDAQAYNDLGVLYFEKGEIEKAQYCLEKSLALDETDDTVRKNLVDLYLACGQSERAARLTGNTQEDSNCPGCKSARPRIIAILAAYNEGDVIYHVIRDLIEQDIEVYLLNHHSTDNTVEEASKWLGKGLIGIELFPEESGLDIPNDVFALRYILMRKEQLVRQFGPGWYINADADEFRESPWPGLNLREGIERVDALGYNTINFAIFDFKPTDNSFVPGDDVRKYLTGYSAPAVSWDKMQARCWKYWGQDFKLWHTGGHLVQFEGRRVFPIPFILRHYPIRSEAHGETKIFSQRKNRFDENEKAANWHVQYNDITRENKRFLWDKSQLTQYDRDEVCRQIHKRFAGVELSENNSEIRIAIVVLVHNQLDDTKKCLESIRRHTNLPYELVVVDNGSTDGTEQYLEEIKTKWNSKHCRAIKVIRHETNLGYAAGNNSGILASEGAYVVILNNDTVVTPGWLERLVRCADDDPRIGIVGPVSNNVSGSQQVESVDYDQTTLEGLEEFAKKWAALHDRQIKPITRVVGFCMLIKREVIETIGGFDPRFGIGNFEDDDFSIRAAIAGYYSVVAQDCFIHHTGSRTFVGQKINHDALMRKNWDLFKAKWGIPAELPLGIPYNMSFLLKQAFNPERHRCPLEISSSSIVWFVAPEWDKPETWCPVIEEYLRSNVSKKDALLSMYAGPRTASDSSAAAELVADFLATLGVDEGQTPDIEITEELPKNGNVQIILSNGGLDEFLQFQYPGRCIRIDELRKAA